jgi:hypothetical protein
MCTDWEHNEVVLHSLLEFTNVGSYTKTQPQCSFPHCKYLIYPGLEYVIVISMY